MKPISSPPQARVIPAIAAMKREIKLAPMLDAPLVVVVGAAALVPAPDEVPPDPEEVVDPLGDGAVAVGEEDAPLEVAAPVGAPKILPSVGTGPIPADADAPIPTSPPTLCPEGPWTFRAAAWKFAKVLPVAGGLMAPTIPALQCGMG